MKPLILAVILAVTASAKDHNWETGKVVDAQTTTTYGGQAGTNGNIPINNVFQNVVIAGDDYTYTAQRLLRFGWSKPANLTVNAPVKFAVEKRKLFLVDDDGKQYELDVVKRAKN